MRSSCVTVETKSSLRRSSSCRRSFAARSSARRRLEFARLLFQLVAVGHDLRGLVEDVRAPPRCRAALPGPPTRPSRAQRRRRWRRPGGVPRNAPSRHPAPEALPGASARLRAYAANASSARPGPRKRPTSARRSCTDVLPRQMLRTPARDAEGINEQQRLRVLARALPAEQRHADIAAQIREHAPEQRMRNRVEPW